MNETYNEGFYLKLVNKNNTFFLIIFFTFRFHEYLQKYYFNNGGTKYHLFVPDSKSSIDFSGFGLS